MAKFTLRMANSLISFIEIAALCVAGIYAAFALWDNNQVYTAAENVQAELLKLKPKVEENGGGGASFEELLAINPDVCAWITIDNTNIDYPVVQGETNLTYINTDVYGEFALAGSIFLDSRCDHTFQQPYNLLYGHHMANGSMFGDLDLFKEEDFFKENRTGTLILPDRVYDLEIYACMLVSASEETIYDPAGVQGDINSLLVYANENALFIHEDMKAETMQAAAEGNTQIVALTTCSSEFTDARTVLLAVMNPHTIAE